ncbi:hypothetical protein NP493_11g01006 [Ridgeia piscesae]|uniref:Sodium/calcium exchanger membrane region domain-containing protein n=1 Tax=Ridgeia piscesae TaxID=27915 RepID=A0AAD9ULD9_RIDPI|nr:hypothetical protein NP493_11g01006 [Ridgeia piscesae]
MGLFLVDGRRRKRRRLPVGWWALSVTVVYLGVVVYLATTTGDDLSGFDRRGRPAVTVSHGSEHHASRNLLGISPNCTPPAIEQFPRPILFTPEGRREGGVLLHIIVTVYMFIALAIVCDDYFVPACESISELLKLQSDVAGATFMAAGSSAPELATALIGVFVAKDDIGLGAVVGSAIFNIMFVISICALFAESVVYLKQWPLLRDCTFYTISVLALVLIIRDDIVHWYEATTLLLLYGAYIIIMFYNSRIEAWIVPKFACCNRDISQGEKTELVFKKKQKEASQIATSESTDIDGDSSGFKAASLEYEKYKMLDDDENEDSVLTMPAMWYKRLYWVIGLPLSLAMYVTIPDCRRTRWKKWFFVTFVMSIMWISIFSYLMIWMITIVGHTFSIPDTVMALTLIAAGTSVPDAIASLLVVRDGYGDMAISNAVGSNVFDVLVCLGLPWFLTTVVVNPNTTVQVYSSGLTYSSLTLLSTVVFLLVATHVNGWRLTKKYGVVLLIVYILFNCVSSLYELNIFGQFNPAACLSNY